jgi:hypothetical protein
MLNETSDVRSHVGKRAIVIGAGVSGLAAARAVADHFEEVVVLERDELRSEATTRPGVPQGTQAHGLLGGAMKGLRELFPGFDQDLVEVVAVQLNPGFEILQEFPGFDPFPRRKWNWYIYSLTRPLAELTIRRRIAKQPNISVRGGCPVVEIVGTLDGAHVTGARRQTDEGPEAIVADLVIDASKHGSFTLSLKQKGHIASMESSRLSSQLIVQQQTAHLIHLTTRDADLLELLATVRHLIKPMSVLNEPDIARRVQSEMHAK